MILDKPLSPTGPLKAEEVRADHITVSWKKPKDNGGSEITGYILEKMDMETGRWVSAGEVINTSTVLPLLRNKSYRDLIINHDVFRPGRRKKNSRSLI